MAEATGTFEVQMAPQAQDAAAGSTLGRMTLDKQFHGDLEATGKGEMLTVRTDTASAAYVAVERVSGTLHGCSGTFALVHTGIMGGDGQRLTVTVVPDSGTGELAGLSGELAIAVVESQHRYSFTYSLAAAE